MVSILFTWTVIKVSEYAIPLVINMDQDEKHFMFTAKILVLLNSGIILSETHNRLNYKASCALTS